MNKRAVLIGALIILAAASSIVTGAILGVGEHDKVMRIASDSKSYFDSVPKSEQDIVDRCSNLNLQDSCYCLSNNVNKIYKYELNENHSSDFDFLIKNGGSCLDWARFYEDLARKMGLKSSISYISDSNDEGDKININAHAFAIIYEKDLDGYCILDGAQVSYQPLKWIQK